jgi:hypothetical protein
MLKSQKIGCVTLALQLLRFIIVTPMYYALMYMILTHIQAPQSIWTLFWVYVPFGFTFALVTEVLSWAVKRAQETEEDKWFEEMKEKMGGGPNGR